MPFVTPLDYHFESIRATIDVFLGFWQLVSIRDDLFDTFRKRNREGGELSDVKLTADSLHRFGILGSCAQFARSLPVVRDGNVFDQIFEA